MPKTVRVIPPTIDRRTMSPADNPRNRRVAAYARVSTSLPEQLTSYEAQVEYYERYIKNHDGWDFAGIYTDEGITGTNTKRRDGFNKMVSDALEGKIDLIITKSVSRFARNTVDTLSTIYKLREHNVECYFEKENLYSFDSKCDLMLTFMSGIAQQESRAISENTTWGLRVRFSEGKVSFAYSAFLGYDLGTDGKLVINEAQAAVARRIYGLFLQGYSFCAIADRLTSEGILTVTGKTVWRDHTIKSILTNEKYRGDAILQKTYTVDFLNKKIKKNDGLVPQYYIKENHEPIIPPEIFDTVQDMIKRRTGRVKSTSVFSGRVFCGICGGAYGVKVWHSNDKYRRTVLVCGNRYKDIKCSAPSIGENELKELFTEAVSRVLPEKELIEADFEYISDQIFAGDETRKKAVSEYVGGLLARGQIITEFDAEMFVTLTERVTVNDDRVVFTFRDKTEITVPTPNGSRR